MSSQEGGTRLPNGGNTGRGQRDSGHLAVFIGSAVAGLRAGDKPTHVVERGCGPTTEVGVYANQRLNLADNGKADGRKAKVPNRTREIRPSGLSGGLGKRGHGGTGIPHRNRKSETGNP